MNQPQPSQAPLYSSDEELLNSLTHALGLVLSIAGLCVLLVSACQYGTVWHIVSSAIFGSSLIVLYTTSTLYHSFQKPRLKKTFRLMDHISIYILIAGTYTPFTLALIRGPLGWTLFGLEWGLAFSGIIFKSVYKYRYDYVATGGYLLMGWLVVIAVKPILNMPRAGLVWLIIGGLCYTLGVPFYLKDDKIKYFHTLWHLMVLAGSTAHFFAILWYVIPFPS